MMTHKLILIYSCLLFNIYFSFINVNGDSSPDAETPDCKVYFTIGYSYNTFFRLPESSLQGNELNLKFLVRAKSNAHVLLATDSKTDPTQPVYEIVIGGGRNTFSEIRRARVGAAKLTTSIPDLLSGTEVRGFWIHITKDGTIEVGKEGDDVPFMYWQDPYPLPIKYFSFSTWSDVFGKWLYDCDVFRQNGTSTVMKKNLTWTDQLRNDLLKNYDNQVIPKINLNQRLVIYIKLECHHIELDSKKNEITVTGIFGMSWTDEKLKWEPSEYGGIKSIQLIHGEIWRPELFLYNAVDYGVEPVGVSGIIVDALGEVSWSPMTRLQAHCKLDLSSWPWDKHTCQLKLGLWALKDFLKLVLLKNETQIIKQRTTSEWKIQSIQAEATSISTPWFDSSVVSTGDINTDDIGVTVLPNDTAINIKITVKRISNIYTFVLLIPLIVTAIVCLISFALPPTATEKIGMQCVCLIISSMFIIVVDSSLPSSCDNVPYIFRAYCKTMIMVTVSIAVSVLVMTIIRQPHFKPPNNMLITILNWSPLKLLLCLPDTSFDGLQLLDQQNLEALTPDNQSHYWILLATCLDRITMIFTLICMVYVLVFS